MTYTYVPNSYEHCKKITWEDVLVKINHETYHKTHTLLVSNNEENQGEVCYVLHNKWYPDNINDAFFEVHTDVGTQHLHIYTSFTDTPPTYGRHKDPCDVLLVQAIGKVKYKFDDGNIVEMNPGDSLHIPVGTYHDPIVTEPRVTLSFAWHQK